jgi:alanine dehydrogenase
MKIGVPKEIKPQEHRVGLVPSSVRELVQAGHSVLVETQAGAGINFTDDHYREAGATIINNAADIFAESEMIIKVKEPQAVECKMLRKDQILFTYLHLAADKAQAEALIKSECVAIAYETVTDAAGGLPLLAPMSEIAGRLSAQIGAYYLQKHMGGTGRLMSGVPGVNAAKVVVIGGGVAGFNAARIAVGMEAEVTILERSQDRIRMLDQYFGRRANVLYSTQDALEKLLPSADVVIGAVLIPGASAPKLVSKPMLSTMQKGSILVDIAIDQGGCFETSRATTHADPVYTIDDVVHYCVANMPGAVPLSSAIHLNNAILPYAKQIAAKGWKKALDDNAHLKNGLNICQGKITYAPVAESLGMDVAYP